MAKKESTLLQESIIAQNEEIKELKLNLQATEQCLQNANQENYNLQQELLVLKKQIFYQNQKLQEFKKLAATI